MIRKIGDKWRLVLFTYDHRDACDTLVRLIAEAGLALNVTVKHFSFSQKKSAPCDIAVTLFTASDDPDAFLADVAYLKVVKKIPVVFAVIEEQAQKLIRDALSELATDDVIMLPVSSEDFGRMVTTHIVALEILNDQQTRKPGDFRIGQEGLGEILVEHGIITPIQLRKALDYQKSSDLRLGDVLVLLGFITADEKNHYLAGQLNVEIASPRQYASAELNTVGLIPESIARRFCCIAVELDGDMLKVAMTDVTNLHQLDTLRDITEMTIQPLLGSQEDINVSIDRFYQDLSSQRDASSLMAEMDEDVEFVQKQDEEVELSIEEATAAGAELGIIKLVNMIIANAVRDRASDVHIEPMERELVVRYRVDGELKRVVSPPRKSHQAIITRIKILSNLDIAERRLPQDGRMVVKIGRREIDIRVSILPSVFGEKAVLRILDKDAFEKSTASLGFTPRDLSTFRANIAKPYGMIIATGPTGSGKSTTLYSAIQSVKSVTKNIVTVEDPVEFHMDGVAQVQVNPKIGLTFGAALRSILRQDPDIVLIGEIRDAETADIAIKMALTGHLVFSTLHTNDAAGAIARLVDIDVPPLLLTSALNLVIAQRLVRRVCPKCKESYAPSPELLEQLNLTHEKGLVFYRGKGCVNCNGIGFLGRTGIFEMLPVSKAVRTHILRNSGTVELQRLAESEGMRTLREVGIDLAKKGETTIEQVIAATTEA